MRTIIIAALATLAPLGAQAQPNRNIPAAVQQNALRTAAISSFMESDIKLARFALGDDVTPDSPAAVVAKVKELRDRNDPLMVRAALQNLAKDDDVALVLAGLKPRKSSPAVELAKKIVADGSRFGPTIGMDELFRRHTELAYVGLGLADEARGGDPSLQPAARELAKKRNDPMMKMTAMNALIRTDPLLQKVAMGITDLPATATEGQKVVAASMPPSASVLALGGLVGSDPDALAVAIGARKSDGSAVQNLLASKRAILGMTATSQAIRKDPALALLVLGISDDVGSDPVSQKAAAFIRTVFQPAGDEVGMAESVVNNLAALNHGGSDVGCRS